MSLESRIKVETIYGKGCNESHGERIEDELSIKMFICYTFDFEPDHDDEIVGDDYKMKIAEFIANGGKDNEYGVSYKISFIGDKPTVNELFELLKDSEFSALDADPKWFNSIF